MYVCTGHVIEEERPAEKGVELLTSTRQDWQDSLMGGHINWHLALYYLGRWRKKVGESSLHTCTGVNLEGLEEIQDCGMIVL